MAEKMLVKQALDERDLLVKKIGDKIAKIKLVDCKRNNEEKTLGERLTTEEFCKQANASYQQIMDLIDRYQRIDAAIIASNASSFVETSVGRMSLACAISMRSGLKTGKTKSNQLRAATDFSCSGTIPHQRKNRRRQKQIA